MSTVYFVRHGQTLFNVLRRKQGFCDSPLTELGIQQVHRAGAVLRERGIEFDHFYSSPSERAVDTLQIVLAEIGRAGAPFEMVKGLKEQNFGLFEGLTEDVNAPWRAPVTIRCLWQRTAACCGSRSWRRARSRSRTLTVRSPFPTPRCWCATGTASAWIRWSSSTPNARGEVRAPSPLLAGALSWRGLKIRRAFSEGCHAGCASRYDGLGQSRSLARASRSGGAPWQLAAATKSREPPARAPR